MSFGLCSYFVLSSFCLCFDIILLPVVDRFDVAQSSLYLILFFRSSLSRSNMQEIQKIVAYESAFEKLFAIIQAGEMTRTSFAQARQYRNIHGVAQRRRARAAAAPSSFTTVCRSIDFVVCFAPNCSNTAPPNVSWCARCCKTTSRIRIYFARRAAFSLCRACSSSTTTNNTSCPRAVIAPSSWRSRWFGARSVCDLVGIAC